MWWRPMTRSCTSCPWIYGRISNRTVRQWFTRHSRRWFQFWTAKLVWSESVDRWVTWIVSGLVDQLNYPVIANDDIYWLLMMVTFPKVLKRLPRSTWSTITLDLSQRRHSSIIILICLNMTYLGLFGECPFWTFPDPQNNEKRAPSKWCFFFMT